MTKLTAIRDLRITATANEEDRGVCYAMAVLDEELVASGYIYPHTRAIFLAAVRRAVMKRAEQALDDALSEAAPDYRVSRDESPPPPVWDCHAPRTAPPPVLAAANQASQGDRPPSPPNQSNESAALAYTSGGRSRRESARPARLGSLLGALVGSALPRSARTRIGLLLRKHDTARDLRGILRALRRNDAAKNPGPNEDDETP